MEYLRCTPLHYDHTFIWIKWNKMEGILRPVTSNVAAIKHFPRGSHIDVTCRSHLRPGSKWNQAINVLFRSRSRDQDEFWATNINQSTHFLRYLGDVTTFCPLNSHKIKQSRASEWSDQAIKDDSYRSTFLIPVANASIGDATCDYPLLPMAGLTHVTTPCFLWLG